MRIWSLHPRHLDRQGLLAMWRESLLAVAVLRGQTRGYRNHPQLARWREQPDPLAALGRHLQSVVEEATARGYRFDATKLPDLRPGAALPLVPVTRGQLAYEREHLAAKLAARDPARLARLPGGQVIDAPASMIVVSGPIADWEVLRTDPAGA